MTLRCDLPLYAVITLAIPRTPVGYNIVMLYTSACHLISSMD